MTINLLIKNLSISRNKQELFNNFSYNINYNINSNNIIAILGNNGAGKTSLLHTIAGLIKPSSGDILLNQLDIHKLTLSERAKKLALLQQISPQHSYCLVKNRIAHGLIPVYGFNLTNIQDNINLIAKNLAISHLLNRPLTKLSGGEQRLVHLAKIFINHNLNLILLDEPSVFLDFQQKYLLANYIKQRAQQNCLIIFSSHDADFIKICASKIIEINKFNINIYSLDQYFSSFRFLDKRNEIANLGESFSYKT